MSKIQRHHLERKAIVYLRQSTLQQVMEHSESTRRQYALRDRAEELGWIPSAIDTIDEDLGRSGVSTENRSGFQRLSDEVARGLVGAIFALEVSRLSRSSADWHRLVELCSVTDVLIVDEQGIYNPREPDDGLILGLKGTFSELERQWIRRRLSGARWAKAQRGAVYITPPTGYMWNEHSERLIFDPDEEVQVAIGRVFELFRRERSVGAVCRYLQNHGLLMPSRTPDGNVRWTRAVHWLVSGVLTNPTYAGAYVYGRRETRTEVVNSEIVRRTYKVPMEEWKVFYKDHHPAYVSWEEYMDNASQLKENMFIRSQDAARRGASRKGEGLLQGIALCGQCARRLYTRAESRDGRYGCRSKPGSSDRSCRSVKSSIVDEVVVRLFLEAVQPAQVDLSLAVAREAEQQGAQIEKQWKLRLERAAYEVRLADRRYKAVDPDNRLVARTLEKEWEEKLYALDELEAQYQEQRQRAHVELDAEDHRRLRQLSGDLSQVFEAETTTMEQRKNLLRILVEQVRITAKPEHIEICVLWKTGATTQCHVAHPRAGSFAPESTVNRIRELAAQNMTLEAIVSQLNQEGIPTARGLEWNRERLRHWCRKNEITIAK